MSGRRVRPSAASPEVITSLQPAEHAASAEQRREPVTHVTISTCPGVPLNTVTADNTYLAAPV